MTWGDPECGGDSSQVQEQLRNVQSIQATDCAFAAILESGAVVTWGDQESGGDSRSSKGMFSTSKRLFVLLLPFLNLGLV